MEYWFDKKAADKAVYFFEHYLSHVKGEHAGKPFELHDWQKEKLIRPIFGWKREDGLRKYRTVYLEVPRKNGKSTLGAGIALCLLFIDGEQGAEVYSAAAETEQAAIVFDVAKKMIEGNAKLSSLSKAFKRTITVEHSGSFYRVLSADAKSKHGFNAHGIVFDELHAQPNRELWDVLTTSTGARTQPLVVAITTAGYDRNSICWELHTYADQVARGIIKDESFLSVIYGAEEGDDWTSPKVWAKANPGLGRTIRLDYLETECKKAQEVPAYENTFRRLHLNQWTQQDVRWVPMRIWDSTAIRETDFSGPCFTGIDLSRTTDLCAVVHVFPKMNADKIPEYHVLPRFWLPGEAIENKERKDRVPYREWARQGHIKLCPGGTINYDYIFEQLKLDSSIFDIKEVAFDRWGASEIVRRLEDEISLKVIEFGQGYAMMSPPTKEALKLIIEGRIIHGGNPILRWNADNVVVEQDAAGNVKPSKAKSAQRIDGFVAMIMGIDRALRHKQNINIYSRRGLITI